MNKEICFIFTTPVLSSYAKRYGIDYFEARGWKTLIWDISPIVHPIAYQVIKSDLLSKSRVTLITSKSLFKQNIKKISERVFFILTEDFNYSTFFIYKNFGKKHHYGYMNRMDTNMEVDSTSVNRLKDLLLNMSMQRIKNSILVRIPRWMLAIKMADFVILGGKANSQEYLSLCCIGKNTDIKYIHSLDYEKYLEVNKRDERVINEKYCVFLDQYLAYHPDIMELGIQIDAKSYYRNLENFFCYIEQTMKVKVIIAAHPRSDYEEHKEVFNNYLIIKNLTCELVKNAEFVLSQHSTAVSYAVLYGKPIIFLEETEHSKIILCKRVLDKYAEFLSAPKVNISDNKYLESKIQDLLYVNKKKYISFIRNFIKAEYGKSNMDSRSLYSQIESLLLSIECV